MITIRKSNSLYTLVSLLGDTLKEKCPANPLHPQTIIVPNLDTARWLKLELAERMDIAANLECILPSEWQYRQIRKLYPNLPKKLPSDILPMTWSLYELLSNEKDGKAYPLLYDYISRQGLTNRETASWQLSSQIASVLDQYLVYRPELLLSWQNGKTGKSTDEQWQAKLWNQLNIRWNKLSDPLFHKNRAELYSEMLHATQQGEIECNVPLFVFNPGMIPAPILQSIKNYSNYQDVLFAYTSPIQMKSLNIEQISNPLLDSLGHEALELDQIYRKHFESAAQVSSKDDTGGSRSNKQRKKTFLNRIQESIQQNTPVSSGNSVDGLAEVKETLRKNGPVRPENAPDDLTMLKDSGQRNQAAQFSRFSDGSIRLHSCHSPLREIETLYHSLLEMFEEDETLNPDDVLVATPDPELYEPFIKAVFGTIEEGLPEIPWHLGSNRSRENEVEKCLRSWIVLPDSRFKMQPVMELFSMQPVCVAAGISEADVNEVRNWMTENSVMWGMDANHREEMGQPPSDGQTWNIAMKRGWLGQWMADEPGLIFEDTLLYAGIRTSAQKEAWAAFSQYLNRLDRARQEIKKDRSGREWCDWIEERLEELISPETLMNQDGSTVRNALELVRESCETVGNQKKISFSLIRSVIISILDRKGSAGALFTRGVTFSSMVPVRSIPFRVIALIGLNESTFPRKEAVIDFDLMAQQPRTGERNRKHEDRNLFLESVLAASDIHYLSYVGQSPLDNEEIPPSTIVTEWIDLLSDASRSKREGVVQKEALHLFSERYFKEQRIYSALACQTASALNRPDKSTTGLLLDLNRETDDGSISDLTLDRFIRFFKNPVRAYLTDHLEATLSNPDEERDEFSLSHLERHLLFQKMMGWLINGKSDSEILLLIRKAGLVQDGWAGESLLDDLLNHCNTALNALKKRGEKPRFTELNIDLQIDEARFLESIHSYRDHSLLDIESSKASGALLIQSWIRHLVWQATTGEKIGSNLLCDLKKGDPKWMLFKPVDRPEKLLQNLISLYQKGQSEPLLFFPKSLFAFKEAEAKGKKEELIKEASNQFEGNDYTFGERNDISIQILLGPEAEFNSTYLKDDFISVMDEMFKHLEGI